MRQDRDDNKYDLIFRPLILPSPHSGEGFRKLRSGLFHLQLCRADAFKILPDGLAVAKR